jgi:hypothetical protein
LVGFFLQILPVRCTLSVYFTKNKANKVGGLAGFGFCTKVDFGETRFFFSKLWLVRKKKTLS